MWPAFSEPNFPRLGQMILDYESPMKKLTEEFVPHNRVVLNALVSLTPVYARRNLSAEQWRAAQMLSLVSSPNQLLSVAQTETVACEYLSVDLMNRWIILCLTLCNSAVGQPVFSELWQQALESGLTMTLFRDEVIATHHFVQSVLETVKGYSKRVSEVKEYCLNASQNSALNHRERRKFLRTALKELWLLFSDEPGLLGPKLLVALISLSLARDEICWLLRHSENVPSKLSSKVRGAATISDRQLPELLFYIVEIRGLMCKYAQVVQRYYAQYLVDYDARALKDLVQSVPSIPEDEGEILSSVCQTISALPLDVNAIYDFRGFRLDLCRLQAYMSTSRSSFSLQTHAKLAYLLNTANFHTKAVDTLDELLNETSDLSLYCFYAQQFEQHFRLCLEFPAQVRYVCAFPHICSHFISCVHEMCPEERIPIGEKSLYFCDWFLNEMSKEARNVVTTVCEQHCILADEALPKNCALFMGEQQRLQAKKGSTKQVTMTNSMPGHESCRRSREEMTVLDKLHFALSELCFAIDYYSEVVVWEHTFAPREYFIQHLQSRFNKAFLNLTVYSAEAQTIAKPSDLLNNMWSYIQVLKSLENYIDMDIKRILNEVLLRQMQPLDYQGSETITTLYTRWYLEVFLRRVSNGQILYYPHHKTFMNHPSLTASNVPFDPEEYADFTELRALAELIGPYGVKFLNERLMWNVASQISEVKKLVIQNKDILRSMRSSFDNPKRMRDLFRHLSAVTDPRKQLDVVDNLLQRITIIGEIMCFKDMVQEALKDVLSEKMPFLMDSVADFRATLFEDQLQNLDVYELCSASGFSSSIDTALVSALKAQKQEDSSEDDYTVCCLLMVFIAVSLSRLARSESTFYKASLGVHLNNSGCLAKAVNGIAGALFYVHGRNDITERLKEFIALASSYLLRIGQNDDKECVKCKESVYIILYQVYYFCLLFYDYDKSMIWQIVEESHFLTIDLMESCFPYILLLSATHHCHRQEQLKIT
ncbi:unnamed protein product [Soboliphyme baturini]|uniref:Nck-associated protein 1 n=1 Tax=Soboliphyme baturini TaxID=241478 RepID=A0A183IPP7_9BILA|nr:unnamed protein product [Soboliphyme baturini]